MEVVPLFFSVKYFYSVSALMLLSAAAMLFSLGALWYRLVRVPGFRLGGHWPQLKVSIGALLMCIGFGIQPYYTYKLYIAPGAMLAGIAQDAPGLWWYNAGVTISTASFCCLIYYAVTEYRKAVAKSDDSADRAVGSAD